ncbi:MAG: ECF transporter S component [Oscillospiraceae bacterium]|nr:ECF transporter S component [Oscillospiraceae bacterium]
MQTRNSFSVKKMVLLAMMAAIAYVVMCFIRIPVVMFLKYEPKDVIITIAGFLFGPLSSFIISFIVSLVEMVTVSDTGPIGALMNLLSTCCFACTASFIYKRNRTMVGAIVSLVIGCVIMVAAMLLWNWLITPIYLGYEREVVAGMLVPVFLPFNLLKGGLNTAFVLFLYKPLVTALRKTGMIETREQAPSNSKTGVYLLGLVLLVTCVLLLLVFQGKI